MSVIIVSNSGVADVTGKNWKRARRGGRKVETTDKGITNTDWYTSSDGWNETQDKFRTVGILSNKLYIVKYYRCRSACLKLHEDSTGRLKEELLEEKRKLELHYQAETTKLRCIIFTL